jgi:hypothetical protein
MLLSIGVCTLVGIAFLANDIRRKHRQPAEEHLRDWDLITADIQKLTPEERAERGLEPLEVEWR